MVLGSLSTSSSSFQNISGGDDRSSGRFSRGSVFDFTNSDVTSLAAGDHVVVVRNRDAFVERYGTDGILIAGEFDGSLGNSVENVRVVGATGESIMDFVYDSSWEPTTAGQGPSLVIRSPTAPLSTWSLASSWRPSFELNGSPGEGESAVDFRLQGDLDGSGTLDLGDVMSLFVSSGRARVGLALFRCRCEYDPSGRGRRRGFDAERCRVSLAVHVHWWSIS